MPKNDYQVTKRPSQHTFNQNKNIHNYPLELVIGWNIGGTQGSKRHCRARLQWLQFLTTGAKTRWVLEALQSHRLGEMLVNVYLAPEQVVEMNLARLRITRRMLTDWGLDIALQGANIREPRSHWVRWSLMCPFLCCFGTVRHMLGAMMRGIAVLGGVGSDADRDAGFWGCGFALLKEAFYGGLKR